MIHVGLTSSGYSSGYFSCNSCVVPPGKSSIIAIKRDGTNIIVSDWVYSSTTHCESSILTMGESSWSVAASTSSYSGGH